MKPVDLSDFDAVCAYVAETADAGAWRMIVVPRQIQKVIGGVMIDDESQEAELYNTCVGRVVSLGDLAFKASTKAHLDLSADSKKPNVGDWIMFHNNAQRRMELRGTGDDRVVFFVLQDTDYLGRANHPDRFLSYLS